MASDASDLCLRCGICCDGTLFTRVPLTANDVVPEEALRVVRTETGARYLPQPCAGLDGTRCTVYGVRPLACRRFECLLVIALKEGEVSLDDATGVVKRAQEKRATKAADLGEYLSFHFGRRP